MKKASAINLLKCSGSILVASFFASCASTTVDELRQGETGIESDESVVILGRRQASDYETRSEFVECVGERMNQGEGAVSVVPEQEFIDAMFPYFEPRTAPLRTRDLEQVMTEDFVASKMNDFGIRYIVWLDGSTEMTPMRGSGFSCSVSPVGGGCFGLLSWEDDSSFAARVWDVGSLRNVGTINADATGQSYIPALVIPIPLLARVEANACSRLAIQLKEFLNDT